MMNGESTTAWRKYESAVDHLRTVWNLLDGSAATETLDKITIAGPRDAGEGLARGVSAVAASLGNLIRADLPKYAAAVVHAAQDEVTAAAHELRSAIERDLKSKFMQD